MDNPYIKIIFRQASKSTPDRGDIVVEYYKPPVRKRFRTGVSIHARNWKSGVVRGVPNAPALNRMIREKVEWVHAQAEMGFSDEEAPDPNKLAFPDWMSLRIEQRTDITESTRRQHLVTMRAVKACGLTAFSDLTVAGLQRLEDHVRKTVTKQSSVYNYHKRLKPYLFIAERLGLIKRNPYRDFKTPHGAGGDRTFLTESERQSLEDLPLTSIRAKVRDMFILSCYTGLSYSDIIKISRAKTVEQDGKLYIVDRRLKTGTKYKLRLLSPALTILERYGWNMNLACNQVCNRELKLIGLMAGINKPLTMHVGRHTFATWALNRDVPIEVVSKMLAHSDIQTTQIYAKILQSSIDAGFDKLD